MYFYFKSPPRIPAFRYFPGGDQSVLPKGGIYYPQDHDQNFMSNFLRKNSKTLSPEEREFQVLSEVQQKELDDAEFQKIAEQMEREQAGTLAQKWAESQQSKEEL